MFTPEIYQAGGLIILVGCYVAIERAYTNNVINDAKQMSVTLLGAGRGSMYNVSVETFFRLQSPPFISLLNSVSSRKTCSGASKTFQKLTSVNLAEKPSSDLKYYFYDIDNPKEYLGGSDAIMVEQGPYKLRCV